MESVAANIMKRHHLKRNVYLQVMSIGLSDLMWKVFATVKNLTKGKNKKLNFSADLVSTSSINYALRLLLDKIKITYFEDIVILFNCIDKIVYWEKNTLFCRCLCLQKQNHVVCINKSAIVIVHCIPFPNMFSHLSHLLKCFR